MTKEELRSFITEWLDQIDDGFLDYDVPEEIQEKVNQYNQVPGMLEVYKEGQRDALKNVIEWLK